MSRGQGEIEEPKIALVETTEAGTDVYEANQAWWDEQQRGPDGTCLGCYEQRAFCQCEDCPRCRRRHDPNFRCRAER